MWKPTWMIAGALALLGPATFAAESESSRLDGSSAQLQWSRWQGRLSLVTASDPWRLGVEAPVQKLSAAALMSDYYFGRSLNTSPGGLRATSGLIFGSRSTFGSGPSTALSGSAFSISNRTAAIGAVPYGREAATDTSTVPYVGIGYTGLSVRSGWSFNADLGLLAQGLGSAARVGRSGNGVQSLDDAVREIRMTPLLQVGASYSF